jgi:hypothetical protein
VDVFREFRQIAHDLAERQIPYALIGGVAMAFYARPRFTKDVDLLIKTEHLPAVREMLKARGYLPPGEPWTFPRTPLSLHRFVKLVPDDEFLVDVIVANSPELAAIADRGLLVESPDHPSIRLARREDIILLKKLRSSPQDLADIALLEPDE